MYGRSRDGDIPVSMVEEDVDGDRGRGTWLVRVMYVDEDADR